VPIRLMPGQVYRALRDHMGCRELRRCDLPQQRMIGFVCTCSGREEMWQIPLTEVRRMGPEWMRVLNALRQAEENWEWRRNVFRRDGWDLHDCDRNRHYEMAECFNMLGEGVVNMAALARLELAGVERDRKQEGRKRVARRKAGILLHRHVTNEQWEQFRRKKHIHVTGSDGRLYRIDKKIGSSVTLVVDGKDVAQYCLVPKGHSWIPEADMMLALKLMLETDALAFTKKANFIDLTPRPVRGVVDGREVMLRIDERGNLVEHGDVILQAVQAEQEEAECPPRPQRRLRRAG
jgi:hypothetical protein